MEPRLDPTAREAVPPTYPEASRGSGSWAAKLWGLAVVSAVVAGAGSYFAGEATHGQFHDSVSDLSKEDSSSQARVLPALRRMRTAAMSGRGGIYYGALGGLLGLGLGLAGGLARGSAGRGLTAGVIGLVLAGAAGFVAGTRTPAVYDRLFQTMTESEAASNVQNGLLLHAAIFVPIGLAAGLALGAGWGGSERTLRGLVGGLVGAALATAVYEFVGLSFFGDQEPNHPLPGTSAMRLFALAAASLGVALGAAFGVLHLNLTPAKRAAD